MTPADRAKANAISFECKKDALQQRQSGDWKVSFTVQGLDMDERLTRAAMGTRFVAVLVEVNDDELPVQTKEKPARPRPKRDWRDMLPTQQAGIRCDDPMFVAFLKEQHADDWHETNDAADFVRGFCGVASRSELVTNHKARVRWHQLDEQFQAWKAMEHA
jgi:hypothetical protein